MPANIKVFLVEDNPMVRTLLKQGLEPICSLSVPDDGADAMLKAIESPPDLIISDFVMSGMDGKALLSKLKGRPATARIAFILMAGKSDIAEKLKIVQDQVEDIVEKPFFVKDAVKRIKRVIDKNSLERSEENTSEHQS